MVVNVKRRFYEGVAVPSAFYAVHNGWFKFFFIQIFPYSLEQVSVNSVSQSSIGDETLALKHILANSPHSLKQCTLLKKELCTACDKSFSGFFINSGYKCLSKYCLTCYPYCLLILTNLVS